MNLIENGKALPLLVEAEAFEGVRRIAAAVAGDVELVTGVRPEVLSEYTGGSAILCATLGKSPLAEQLEKEGRFSAEEIRGKREVYKIAFVGELLVIVGSDKRGTIYGMFALSEYLGVTPLVYFGDAAPAKCAAPVLGQEMETVSKEPSVRFRGFFINDEWPCFGNWAMSHFGGVNADMYALVFEFLLRMKGNYLWPAMWASSFPLDGPGSANEELADMYGVVMGYSHHEPCLRASEEWDKVRGEGTRYGNEWNFYTNEQGLLNYWEDSLKRSGKYENIITIGMRGERDSSMLGDKATVEENVNLLKDIIRKQRQLIRENVNEDLSQVPQMLALYKEVEAYFYGDEHVAGLKDWDELDGVICMLCEDNFGHMRTLPTPEIRDHKGGFGMYYHFDYHGGPISYEWVDSTPMSKTWEQMCTAYEYGIRDLWIVNVGDLKFHEVPLTYFLALAYDYDKWGISNPESYREFTADWAKKCFPAAGEVLQQKAAQLLTSYIDMNHLRRPESLNENIYHPCHYNEADKMLDIAEQIEKLHRQLMEGLSEEERNGYYSMAGFSAAASANLLKMHLYAAKSAFYARQGRTVANSFAALARECIRKDREYAEEFSRFKDGKWNGMQLASHIGFTKWNDDGCRYPVVCTIEPQPRPRMSVSRKDEPRTCVKNYGGPDRLFAFDFCDEGCEQVVLEAANDGIGRLNVQVSCREGAFPAWLTAAVRDTGFDELQEVVLSCDRTKLPAVREQVCILISDGDTTVACEVAGQAVDKTRLPKMTFLPRKGVVVIDAKHYAQKKDTDRGAFYVIDGYGKYGSAVKVAPATEFFRATEDKPEVTYNFYVPKTGEYLIELMAAPTNPCVNGTGIHVQMKVGSKVKEAMLVGPEFKAGNSSDANWSQGVLDQIRSVAVLFALEAGVNSVTIGAREAGLVLERIRVRSVTTHIAPSYIGPDESAYVE